jgi:hypothetical protein
MRVQMKRWVLLGLLVAASASGQTASSVPVLQGAALPMYPPIAKAAHITGKVMVRVTVKDGLVVKTDVLSKPYVRSGQRFLESAGGPYLNPLTKAGAPCLDFQTWAPADSATPPPQPTLTRTPPKTTPLQ